jgi:hypothetical protein
MCPSNRHFLIVVSRSKPRLQTPAPVPHPNRGLVAPGGCPPEVFALLIPDPPSIEQVPVAGGEGGPARDESGKASRAAGPICAACGQPLEQWTRDLWCWASETTVAYVPCLFAVLADE